MVMLASDVNNPEFAGAVPEDSLLAVEFYDYKAIDKWETEKTGIKTYKKECPFVRISVPGNDKSVIERPAEARDVQRFPKHWLYYQMQTGKIANAENVPGWQIDQWPELDADQVRNLKHLRFYTVEQIAGANDAQVQGIGMGGHGLKTRAIAALEARNSIKTNTELAKRDDMIASLKDDVAKLTELVMRQAQQKPVDAAQAPALEIIKKRGRPAKQAAA